jgi:RNA recognition motif-containing protein
MAVMNILVSNLSANIIGSDLVQIFSVYGEVSYAAIVRDKSSGRSKGNAFLEMPNEAEAEQAIIALNRTLLDGKQIVVQEIIYKPGEFNN